MGNNALSKALYGQESLLWWLRYWQQQDILDSTQRLSRYLSLNSKRQPRCSHLHKQAIRESPLISTGLVSDSGLLFIKHDKSRHTVQRNIVHYPRLSQSAFQQKRNTARNHQLLWTASALSAPGLKSPVTLSTNCFEVNRTVYEFA